MTNRELFQALIDKLATEPRSYDTADDPGFWADGNQILCPSEAEADMLAEFLKDVFIEWDNTNVLTGYYDPFEDEEQDDYTGFWYVTIE